MKTTRCLIFVILVMAFFSGAGAEEQKKDIANSIGMTFVYISPGSFTAGSPANEPGRDNDEDQREITLTKGFYLQTTEVTQKQWMAVMWKNPSHFSNSCGKECPVENVTWDDAQTFIKKLNKREKTDKYRLPTEAEWEYACRAGSGSAFANGDITEPRCGLDPVLDVMGWYCGNSDESTHPVARKQPNAWGLYDMHGNVWEWCQDRQANQWEKDRDGYACKKEGDDPVCTAGSLRVSRGGSFQNGAGGCRSADRSSDPAGSKYRVLGFRVAMDP